MTIHLMGEMRPENQPSNDSTQPQARPITRQEQAELSNLLCKKCRRGTLRLDADVLINRVKRFIEFPDDGFAYYLAIAFLSSYRNVPFNQSLFQIVNMSAEDLRLFNQILYMRHVPGWDDAELYRVEQEIVSIVKEAK